MKVGVIGTGQFAGSFIRLWQLHPDVEAVYVTDLRRERAEEHQRRYGVDAVFADVDELLASDCDSVAVMTQRWTHAPLVLQALAAGRHVYSAVPMALTRSDIGAIIDAVRSSGLVYMMGETSYYNPAVVFAREKVSSGAFGRVFYAEGDYVHDMDNGFYAAYQFSGGEEWKATASFPPMWYPTHAVGGVLGALPTHAASVSCIGVPDDRGDGVFDRSVSAFGNDFSNMSAHFGLADGGVMRTNEFRRVGHPAQVHESRFRFYGTEAVMEQSSTGASWSTRADISDISELFFTGTEEHARSADLVDLDDALVHSFASGTARVHDRTRLPAAFDGAPNGHEGAHHFLADDFVRAVTKQTQPPVNAWLAARFTLPGIVAYESALADGRRLPIADFGAGPPLDPDFFG